MCCCVQDSDICFRLSGVVEQSHTEGKGREQDKGSIRKAALVRASLIDLACSMSDSRAGDSSLTSDTAYGGFGSDSVHNGDLRPWQLARLAAFIVLLGHLMPSVAESQ